MIGLIFRRILWTLPVLLVISAVTFGMMKLAPGGPWDRDSDAKQIDPRVQRILDQQFGLDKPVWRQFTGYVFGDFTNDDESFRCGAICGNLGPSFRQRGQNVEDILFKSRNEEDPSFFQSKFGYSIRLGLLALVIAITLAIPLGVAAALYKNSLFDYFVTFITNVGISVPSFVVAIFMIIIFATQLKWIDVRAVSWTVVAPWILPASVLGFGTLATLSRLMRSSMLDVMQLEYIRTARAKGLKERYVIWRHMFRNSLIPVITVLGPALAGLVTGSIILEQMFAFPGIGTDFIRAIGNRDYSLIMGTTLLYAVLIVLANLSVDIVYGLIDPRIRVD